MKREALFVLAIFCSLISSAQSDFDIATVFSYNILNYRNDIGQCDASTNSPKNKEENLVEIIQHVDPDIVCFQEVGASSISIVSNLLDKVMNVDGVTKYDVNNFQSNSNMMNVIFYNTEMFTIYKEDQIRNNLNGTSIIRLIDAVTFYYNDPVLPQTNDTTFLTVFAAHLKAGNSSTNEAERARATAAIMDYIEDNTDIENYLLAGDLNVYDGGDPAFDNLMNGSRRFYDPLSAVGKWSNSGSFAWAHTQSTRSSQTNSGCFSGGGMDDRFDFILMSEDVKDGNNRVEYIRNSYKALGQDGLRFNETVRFPANTSEPSNVIDALHEVSDHLPIVMDLQMFYSAPVGITEYSNDLKVNVKQTTGDQRIGLEISGNQPFNGQIRIVDLTGRTVFDKQRVQIDPQHTFYPAVNLHGGLFIVQLVDSSGEVTTLRFYKN